MKKVLSVTDRVWICQQNLEATGFHDGQELEGKCWVNKIVELVLRLEVDDLATHSAPEGIEMSALPIQTPNTWYVTNMAGHCSASLCQPSFSQP